MRANSVPGANGHIVLVAAILLPCAIASGQMPATKVVFDRAKMIEAPGAITLVGTVRPVRWSDIGAESSGVAVAVPVRQGDRVAKGDLICELSSDVLQQRRAAAFARLQSLQARHAELESGTRDAELRRLAAALEEAQASLERWTFEKERVERLEREASSNSKEMYDTEAGYEMARQRVAMARADHDLAVEGIRKEVIQQAAHDVAQQEAVVGELDAELEKKRVLAPYSGYIVELHTEVGQMVPLSSTVASMVDLSSVLVRVDVPESARPYIKPGDAARVMIDALKRNFSGRVKHVVPHADEAARTFRVEVEVSNEEGVLIGGMFARATLTGGATQQITAVPRDSIVEIAGVSNLGMLMPGERGTMGMLMPVTLGAAVGDWVAITSSNVRPGTPVVVRGTERLMPFPSPVITVDELGTPVTGPFEGAGPAGPGGPSAGGPPGRDPASAGRPGAGPPSPGLPGGGPPESKPGASAGQPPQPAAPGENPRDAATGSKAEGGEPPKGSR